MSSIYSIGSINADLVVNVDELPNAGETKNGHIDITVGGKGYNQAVAAHRLVGKDNDGDDIDVFFFGANGTEGFSEFIENSVEDLTNDNPINNPRTSFQIHEGNCGVATVIVDRTGQNRIILDQGANGKIDFLQLKDAISQPLPDIILLQNEINPETTLATLRFANENGIFTILDPAPMNDKMTLEMIQLASMITPNEGEFLAILKRELNEVPQTSLASVSTEYLLNLLIVLDLKRVALTLGRDGVRYYQKAGVSNPLTREVNKNPLFIDLNCLPVKDVDTTAAGDTFNGALAAALLSNGEQSLEEKFRFAVAAASISTESPGAAVSIPYRDNVLQRLW